MQQLTGLDAAFLAMETPAMYGHVGSICILDPSGAPNPLTLASLTDLIESRLYLIPPFRRRLVDVPLGLDQPYWIEDPDFDIEYHVRELALPAPGDDQQLAEQAARLHARHLDRRRPLWEVYLIHGLSGGRVAIYTKVHHAAIDGVSGNDILTAILDTSPDGRPDDGQEVPERDRRVRAVGAQHVVAQRLVAGRPPDPRGRGSPTRWRCRCRRSRPARPGRTCRSSTGCSVATPTWCLPRRAVRAPSTPFNKPIGPHRRWAFRTVPFEEVRAVKNASGTTINDVVMALCTGALRRWLEDHDALPDAPLVAAVPVSIRTEEQIGTGGNRVSMIMAALPTNLSDPTARLQAAHEAMRAAKEQHGAMPADLLTDVAQFAMPALAGQAARLSARLRLHRADQRVQPDHLQRARPDRPALLRRREADRLLPAVRDRRRPGAQHHGDELWRRAALRADRRSRPGP